jgi:hypothetical protein
MTRLTSHDINENGRELAKQLRGLSVSDAKQVLAHVERIIEDESVITVQKSDQVKLHVGTDLHRHRLDSGSQRSVNESEIEIVEGSNSRMALGTGDNNHSDVETLHVKGFGNEPVVSTFGALNHENLHSQQENPTTAGQAIFGQISQRSHQ